MYNNVFLRVVVAVALAEAECHIIRGAAHGHVAHFRRLPQLTALYLELLVHHLPDLIHNRPRHASPSADTPSRSEGQR